MIFEPSGLFVKILTAHDKYSLRKSENFREPIQTQLSKNLKSFSQYFAQFVQSASNFKHLGKNDDPRSVCIFEVRHCEKDPYKNVSLGPSHSTSLQSTC